MVRLAGVLISTPQSLSATAFLRISPFRGRSMVEPMKILIGETGRANRLMLESLITGLGHEPVFISDGAAAMKACEANDAPPVAILDWMMPGFEGAESCKRLRELQKHTYVLMVAPRNHPAVLEQAFEAGVNGFITEPLNREELQARLDLGVRFAEEQLDLTAR